MVHKAPSPWDSTNRAMVASTSDNSDPARISFRMLRTGSLEKKPNSSCARSILDRSCARDGVAKFIPSTSGSESRLGQSESDCHKIHKLVQLRHNHVRSKPQVLH